MCHEGGEKIIMAFLTRANGGAQFSAMETSEWWDKRRVLITNSGLAS